MTDIAVIILTINQRETTMRCLGTVLTQDGADLGVLVWDNGSCDGTREAIQAGWPQVVVHRSPVNMGVAAGRNAAARLALREFGPPRCLLFLDNDLELKPGFVSALREPFASDDRLAQTQAKLLFSHDSGRLNDGGGCQIQFWLGRTTPVGYGEADRGQYDRPSRCIAGGGAMMVRADVFRQLDGFDETFGPFGPEDLDFSLRVLEAGYHALYVPGAVAFHTPSHTRPAGYGPAVRVRHWLEFCRRHASAAQRLGFLLVGAPLMYARTRFALWLRERRTARYDPE